MNTFLGKDAAFWTGLEALAVCTYTIVFTISLWLIYQQVRTAAKALNLDGARRLQELVDDFRDDRAKLFSTLPLELALHQEQFLRHPPKRHEAQRITDGEMRKIELTEVQKAALQNLTKEQRDLAERVISRLNDIGELYEYDLINRRLFMGKYHVMVIQCCHLVEAVRRDLEKSRSGNYGQRLLRLRHWATVYNDIIPKHREVPIAIRNNGPGKPVTIYQSPAASWPLTVAWTVRRWFFWL